MHFSWNAALFVFGLICLLGSLSSTLPDGRSHVYVLDVGQGDSILIVSPSGKNILIDGGPDLSALEHIGKIIPFFNRTIDLLVLTHPDQDHITAIPEILHRYHVKGILFGGTQKKTARYQNILSQLFSQKTTIILPDPKKDIDMGDGLVLDIISPDHSLFGTTPKKSNNTSIVIRAISKNGTVLLTGDMEKNIENTILKSGSDIKADILKVPHHGSRTSSSSGFILNIKPFFAIFSVGKDNTFGHPHKEIVDRYRFFGIQTKSTIDDGTISFIF